MKRLVLTLVFLASFALGGMAQDLHFDFDDGTLQGWTIVDADSDGHCWEPSTNGMGHLGSNGMVMSYSWDGTTGFAPDNYLVSPVTLSQYYVISFWACALDETYTAEHFGVCVSYDGTSNWIMLQEWTMTAKKDETRQGNWYQYTVDLSSYAGDEVYVAIRHHNAEGVVMSAICIDDITLEAYPVWDDLVITPSILTFDTWEVKTFTATNATTNPVTVSSTYFSQQYIANVSPQSFTLQPGQSMNVEVELNEIGFKGYVSTCITLSTSLGSRYVLVRINEAALGLGLMPWPMGGLYFDEDSPLTQTFWLRNTFSNENITLYDLYEDGSDYFEFTLAHDLPYEIQAGEYYSGEYFAVTATLVNFPENATTANVFVNSSQGQFSTPFLHIAGGLSPSNGDLVIDPDTLWVTDVYVYQKYFTITNETDHQVTISNIYTEDTIVSLSHYDPAYGLVNVEEVLPVTLEAGDEFEIKTGIQNIILPWAKRNEYIVAPIHIVSTEGEDEVIMMIDEAAISFGLIAYGPFYALNSYDPESFSLVNAEWSGGPITITGIEEKDTDYLDISTDLQLPVTLENYGDYMRGSLKCKETFAVPGFVSTSIIVHTSIGDFEPIGVDIYGELFVSPFNFNPEWYYEIQNENGSITYQYLYQAGDTIVQDEPTHILVRINTLYDKDEHTDVTYEYVYERDGKLYWWNKTLEEFTVLYDFNAQVGDIWEIKVGTESLMMHVDAVEEIEYEGRTYRMLHVSDPEDLFSGNIVCGIGHLTSFFPERLMDNGDGFRVEGLRCYWIEDELVFKIGDEDCNAIYSEVHGVEENGPSTGSGTLTVYPNPTNGILVVETQNFASLPAQTYRITNLMGQTVLSGSITAETQQIDVSGLSEGMYFMTIGSETRKFVVNK